MLGALYVLGACGGSPDEPLAEASGSASTISPAVAAPTRPTDAGTPAQAPASDAPAVDTSTAPSTGPGRSPEVDIGDSRSTTPPPAPVTPPIDARSPDQVVADTGERGHRYLGALRAAGIPTAGMDAQEVLYAQGVCQARADGMSRAEILGEFDGVSQAYASFLPMPAGQVAEIFVSTAEGSYC